MSERIVNRVDPGPFYKLDERAIKADTSDLDELLQTMKSQQAESQTETVKVLANNSEWVDAVKELVNNSEWVGAVLDNRTKEAEQAALKTLESIKSTSGNFWQDRIKSPQAGNVVQTAEAARSPEVGKVEFVDKQFQAQQEINGILEKAIEPSYSSEAELWSQFLKFRQQVIKAFKHLGLGTKDYFGE